MPELTQSETVSAVREILASGWFTPWEVRDQVLFKTGDYLSEQGIGARMRDLRKPQFGGFTVNKKLRRKRVWEYSLGGDV